MQLHYVIRKQVSRVDLQKDGTTSIGIVLKDGVKTGSRPVIRAIKKGSVAYRSHCVSERDAIVSVCGQDARGMSRRDFKHLLREAESVVELELEYQIQEACLNICGVYRMERIDMKLKKESESFGFVLRKYGYRNPASPGYPVISNLKEGGPADRDGRLKSGDRILKIDEQDLELLSLSQVADILQTKDKATFTIEYKIALIENSQIRLGERTNLEIDCPDADLGLVLGSSGSRMIVEKIQKGSLADRSGAFRVGDDILAINDIDVVFLSTSKANSLLRNFKKEPGRLVLVANEERLLLSRQNSGRGKFKPSFNATFLQLTPERDQQVPSSGHLVVPCNSPQSLFDGNFEDNTGSSAEVDFYNFQIKAIAMLRETIKSVTTTENFISSLINNKINTLVENLDEIEDINNGHKTTHFRDLSYLKVLFTQTKNYAHSMAMHFVKNNITSNRLSENGSGPNDNFRDNHLNLNQNGVNPELKENLVEIYSKKLISKQNFEKLQFKMNQINLNCKKCDVSGMFALLQIQKILLIVSLDSQTEDISFLISKLVEETLRIKTCKDCLKDSKETQTGSETRKTTNEFHFSNSSRIKPSSLMNSQQEMDSCSSDPTECGTTKTTFVRRLKPLQTKAFRSAPIVSSDTEFKSPVSVDSLPSTNDASSKTSSRKAISDSNSKPRTSNSSQLRNHCKKQCQRKLKEPGNDSLCFEKLFQPQYESEGKMIHNGAPESAGTLFQPQYENEVKMIHNGVPERAGTFFQPQYESQEKMIHNGATESARTLFQPQYESQEKMIHNGAKESAGTFFQPQYESQEKMIHNGSSACATQVHCPSLYNRDCMSEDSTSQPSFRTPYNTQDTTFTHETDLLPCKDTSDYAQKNSGKNYSSTMYKKLLREKGLLKVQRQNSKSAEAIGESESKSLKNSKPNIQKHSSEPQFLSMGTHSEAERIPNRDDKNQKQNEKVEIPDSTKAAEAASADASRYWSPFNSSNCDDRPNILDISNWCEKSSHLLRQINQVSNEITMQDRMDVTLKNEGKGHGLSVEFLDLPSEGPTQVPRIIAVSPQGAAHKIGILQKGDRVLAINGENTTGMTITEFERLKEDALNADEVFLTVEFDIAVRGLQFGTFDVCVTKTSKTGLIYGDFKKGSPLVVKGIVKGSPAHRCGLLFPGDEVLYANNIRQEFYDVFKNTYEKSEYVTIRVRRQTFEEKFGNEINFNQAELPSFKTYDLNRTSIHSNHDSNKMFLEQELVLYRDPVVKDFGFLIGQDPSSKTIYVTGIRPEGPADCSKVIRKNDIILQVNGVNLETYKDGAVVSLFHPTGDRLDLKTRRIL